MKNAEFAEIQQEQDKKTTQVAQRKEDLSSAKKSRKKSRGAE